MDKSNVRIRFEITKPGALNPGEEQQLRALKLQASALQEKGMAHSSELVYNGMDDAQVLAVEALIIDALGKLNAAGAQAAKNASA